MARRAEETSANLGQFVGVFKECGLLYGFRPTAAEFGAVFLLIKSEKSVGKDVFFKESSNFMQLFHHHFLLFFFSPLVGKFCSIKPTHSAQH